MTSLTVNKSERHRLAVIASEYQDQGYDVQVQPSPDRLPDFLSGFEPDLIATGKGETVVVEVKNRSELKNVTSITALEEILRNRPGWRFELIIDGTVTEQRQTINIAQIRASLTEAEELQQNKHLTAALLLLWSAAEGALRLLADRESVELESLAPAYVVKRLYMIGLLEREQYQVLDETMKLRSHAAHGFQVSITPEDLMRIAVILRELLSEVEAQAA